MKWSEQQALFKAMVKEEADLLNNKGKEYASDHDALDNFKSQAVEMGVDPLVVLAIFMNKHYRSIQSYIRNGRKTKSSESIEGRIADLRNYAFLAACLIKDVPPEELTEEITKKGPPLDQIPF